MEKEWRCAIYKVCMAALKDERLCKELHMQCLRGSKAIISFSIQLHIVLQNLL